MKRILLFVLFFVGLVSYAQGTTQKELNYISIAYKQDLETGRDIIQGYKVELLSSNTTNTVENGNKTISRKSSLYKFIRTDTNKIAAFLLIDERHDSKFSSFLCVPNNYSSNEIWLQSRELYLKNSSNNKCENVGAAFAYSWNHLMLISKLLSN